MSVYKPKGSRIWQYDFVVAKRRYSGSTGVLNRRAAERVERIKRNQVADGTLGAVATMTFDAAAGRYWEEKGKSRGDATDVERRIDVLLDIIGKDTQLADIDQAAVAAAIETRRGMTFKKGKDRHGIGGNSIPAKEYAISNSTVNRDIIETLRPILKRARTHWTKNKEPHGLPEIDWRELRLKEPRALSRLYNVTERTAWLDACETDNIRLALDIILTYGLRFGEIFFHPDSFDPEADDGPVLSLQKGRKRDVILYLPIRADHARQIAALVGRARAAGLKHLWFERVGKKLVSLTYAQMEYRISKAADVAGITGGRRIHGARHHAGSTILRKTKNLKAVQGLLGHARISSSERYAHVLISDLRAALEDDTPRNSPEADKARKRQPKAG